MHPGLAAPFPPRPTLTHPWCTQVSDESLAALQSMGYDLREGTRGLRFSGGSDVAGAIDFIGQQRIAAEVVQGAGAHGGWGYRGWVVG